MEGLGNFGGVRPKAWDILSKEYPVRKPSSTSKGVESSFKGLKVRKESSPSERVLVPCSVGPKRSLRQSVIEKTGQTPTVSEARSLGHQAGSYVPDAFDPVYRQSWDDCKFRYKLPEVPQPDSAREIYESNELSLSDRDHLIELQEACKTGVDSLKEVISGESQLYEWLIFKARDIEKMFTGGKNIKKAEKWASTLDAACQGSPFDWRKLPLAVNYAFCSESKCKTLFPGDRLEKNRLRKEPVIMFFPPWVEKSFRDMPLSTIYSRYWSIRNSLGHKDESFQFTDRDFVKSYPSLHSWFVAFQNASPKELEKQGFSELEVEAFKYLLDQTDAGVNVVKGKPQWHWQDVVSAKGEGPHQVSGEITSFIQSQDHLADLEKPAPSRPVEPLSDSDSDSSTKKARRAQSKKISVDPLSADLGEHVHVGLPERRKRTFVEREGVMDWDAVTKSMITSDYSEPVKKCKLTVTSSEPVDVEVDVEVDLKEEGMPLMVVLDLSEEMLAKIPPGKGLESDDEMEVEAFKSTSFPKVLTPTGGIWLPYLEERGEGWSVDSDGEDSLLGDKDSESGFLADDKAGSVHTRSASEERTDEVRASATPEPVAKPDLNTEKMETEVESVLMPLIDEVDHYPRSSATVTGADLLKDLPGRDEIRVSLECVQLTKSYAGKVDFFELNKGEDIELLEPVDSLTNWVIGLESKLTSKLEQKTILENSIDIAKKEVAASKDLSVVRMTSSRLRKKEQKLESMISKNDQLMKSHMEAFTVIINGLRTRLEKVEDFVAEKVKKYFADEVVPANLKEELSGLLASIDSAYEVLGDFEAKLETMQQFEDYPARVAACQALKEIDFSALKDFV
ncbi:hypothetical protein [Endozoicomonas numazuensis]|uniref:Uncharacterized protein n=1 Tax=Endozoicomonas numazuensis TaxID=1137799 RepID=A0A081NHS4_9GAMM|nr:hypothetical protein [Endozoicomonas numazuensis]KEQ17997.1 hypothetical protein GZ78_10375 [Endozoicomonas numazuensis]